MCYATETKLIPSSLGGRKPRVRAAQMDLNKEQILSVVSLLSIPRLPTIQLLDFMWLISSRATYAANVEGFVSPAHGLVDFLVANVIAS